jgi:coiled-coil domain-containing protein 55
MSKLREVEKDRIYERKLLKERKQEDELFADTEKFVTSAYREKLEQDAKWDYEDK